MSISNTNPNPKDIVILQRDDANTYYGETHISGSNLILHVNSSGNLDADTSSSFYSLYPVTSASFAISASWAPPSSGSSVNEVNLIYTSSYTNIPTSYIVYQTSTSSYNAVFIDYVVISQSNCRCGTIFGCWVSGSLSYSEYTTTDLGNTSMVTMSLALSGQNIQLLSTTSTLNWKINIIGKYI